MKTTLSPREMATAIGVSESSVKRWVDDGVIGAVRTRGGHRRITVVEAVRFVRASGIPVIRPDLLGLPDLETVSQTDTRHMPEEALREALLAGQVEQVRGLVLSLYLAGRPVAEAWDRAIAPAMRHLGTLWEHDPRGIYLEHRATDLCIQAITRLRLVLPLPTPGSPLAMGGAPSGDPYALPSLMAATVAAAAGFREINLGPETPMAILAQAAAQFEAKMVWLAVTAPRPQDELLDQAERLARDLEVHGAHLVIGGRALPQGMPARRPNMYIAETMAGLEAFAKGLVAAADGAQENEGAEGEKGPVSE